MASSTLTHCQNGLLIALILILVFSLTILPPKSVGLQSTEESSGMKPKKMILGSRPPQCVNRCLGCRPCMATLVTPHSKDVLKVSAIPDENYYLLFWKCKCGNKYFQP